ncbi:MAG: addiction module protein [Myxococcota bacterium]
MAKPAIDLSEMTADEKLELIDEIWQSLGPEAFSLTAQQRDELDRRLDRIDRSGPAEKTWEDVRSGIAKGKA